MNNAKICMYNVKGIQKYIYTSSKLKEIVGASALVAGCVIDNLKTAALKVVGDTGKVIFDICKENQINDLQFDHDNTVSVELVYEGGGNVVVLYRDEDQMNQINMMLSTVLAIKNRGMQLIVASKDKTDDYQKDMSELRQKMTAISENMPPVYEMNNLPVTMDDSATGEPLTRVAYTTMNGVNQYRRVSESSYQKLIAFDANENKSSERYLPQKGRIAVVHADGNNMGINIANALKGVKDYDKAVRLMRQISHNIDTNFKQAFDQAIADMNQKEPFVRKIILSGDDSTYVIKADYAMEFTTKFIQHIEEHFMIDGVESSRLRACAGIVYVHSHFPFSEAYKMAEMLCESAKSKAKKSDRRKNGQVLSYVDFQICLNGATSDLERMREREYVNADGYSLLSRPYCISKDCRVVNDCIDKFNQSFAVVSGKKENEKDRAIARNKAKLLRDAYYESESYLKNTVNAVNSRLDRKYQLDTEYLFTEDHTAYYFDALDLLDMLSEEATYDTEN